MKTVLQIDGKDKVKKKGTGMEAMKLEEFGVNGSYNVNWSQRYIYTGRLRY